MLIILACLWSSFLDERVQVQTFAKLGPVFLACKNSDAAILLSPYLQLQGPLFFLSGCLLTHKHSPLPPPASPPMSPALCQAEARLTTMWISIPRTRCAELCPVVPNHQQCAFCYTHTHSPPHNRTKHAALNTLDCRKSDKNFYIDPFPEQPFSPQTISTRDSATADALGAESVFVY